MTPAEKLLCAPGVQRVPTRDLELFIVRHFLDEATCAALIERIDAQRRPSEIADDLGIANFRTSETCDLDWRDPVVGAVDRKIADLLGLPLDSSEPLQGQHYAPGQEFKPHTDTFEPGRHDYFLRCADSGNRSWTAMIYLNEPDAGGATRFKLLDFQAEPRLGRILIWNNMALDGSPNPWTLHEGMPVEAGTKYIVTKWYRERPFV